MKKIHHIYKASLSLILISANTLIWFPVVIIVALLKLLIPFKAWRNLCTRVLTAVSETWSTINMFNIRWHLNFTIDCQLPDDLKPSGRYLVLANHQSWTDILILQMLFNRKIPFFKFFLKSELIFIPVLGLAWWALDYPFMKRYTREKIERNPSLKGKDMEITRKACAKYHDTPFSIVNFLEGTRFTKQKHSRQNSPYTHLLKPKAGGISYVLYALGHDIDKILDITIIYPEEPKFWNFISGQLKSAKVLIKEIEFDENQIGNYSSDEVFRKSFQNWINKIWKAKDKLITENTTK